MKETFIGFCFVKLSRMARYRPVSSTTLAVRSSDLNSCRYYVIIRNLQQKAADLSFLVKPNRTRIPFICVSHASFGCSINIKTTKGLFCIEFAPRGAAGQRNVGL